MKKLFLILFLLVSIKVSAQQNYGISVGSHIDYNEHTGCIVDSCFLFGATIIFNGNNQRVGGTHMDQQSFLEFDTTTGATVTNCQIGKGVYVTPPRVIMDGCVFESGVGWSSGFGGVDSALNCHIAYVHSSSVSEYGSTFLGKGLNDNIFGQDSTNSGTGNGTWISANDISGQQSITLKALKGIIFRCGTRIGRLDSSGFYFSNFGLGLIYSTAAGRFAVLADGTANQVLKTNGSGTYSWTTPTLGTVTSVATGYGLSGGTITSAGTLLADTSILLNKTGVQTVTNKTISFASNTFSGSLAATLGGTGLSSYAIGDLLYAPTTTTVGKLPDIARGSVLLSNGVSGLPFYGKVRLDSAVAGVTPLANGGTGLSAVPLGNILVSSGSAMVATTPTSSDGSVTIVTGSGTLDLTVTGGITSSGTYSPTVNSTTNVAAHTEYPCQYMRVGNTVTVSGKIDIQPTLPATLTNLDIDLPVAISVFNNTYEAGGAGYSNGLASAGFAVYAEVAETKVFFEFISTSASARSFYFTFTYQIIP